MAFDGRMTTSTTTLEVLPYDECLALLRVGGVGRLAWAEPDRVVVVPVNFAWDGDAIVFRTDPGQKVDAVRFQRIAFEIDGFDAARQEGWSVLANGTARLTDPADWPSQATAPDQLALEPWAPGSKEQWMRLVPDRLTGRRLVHQRPGTDALWRYSAYS